MHKRVFYKYLLKKIKVERTADDGLVEPVKELCEEVETVKSFCYLGDRVNQVVVVRQL